MKLIEQGYIKAKGTREQYFKNTELFEDIIYFAEDTQEILLNSKSYSGIADVENSGYTKEEIDKILKDSYYTQEEVDKKIRESGNFDPDQYYTKNEIDSELENIQALENIILTNDDNVESTLSETNTIFFKEGIELGNEGDGMISISVDTEYLATKEDLESKADDNKVIKTIYTYSGQAITPTSAGAINTADGDIRVDKWDNNLRLVINPNKVATKESVDELETNLEQLDNRVSDLDEHLDETIDAAIQEAIEGEIQEAIDKALEELDINKEVDRVVTDKINPVLETKADTESFDLLDARVETLEGECIKNINRGTGIGVQLDKSTNSCTISLAESQRRGESNGVAPLQNGKLPEEYLPYPSFNNFTINHRSTSYSISAADNKNIVLQDDSGIFNYTTPSGLIRRELNNDYKRGIGIAPLEDGKVPESYLPDSLSNTLEIGITEGTAFEGNRGKSLEDWKKSISYQFTVPTTHTTDANYVYLSGRKYNLDTGGYSNDEKFLTLPAATTEKAGTIDAATYSSIKDIEGWKQSLSYSFHVGLCSTTYKDSLIQVSSKVVVPNTGLYVDTPQKIFELEGATSKTSGVMTASDWTKLNGIEEGAQKNVPAFETIDVFKGEVKTRLNATDNAKTLTIVGTNGILTQGMSTVTDSAIGIGINPDTMPASYKKGVGDGICPLENGKIPEQFFDTITLNPKEIFSNSVSGISILWSEASQIFERADDIREGKVKVFLKPNAVNSAVPVQVQIIGTNGILFFQYFLDNKIHMCVITIQNRPMGDGTLVYTAITKHEEL